MLVSILKFNPPDRQEVEKAGTGQILRSEIAGPFLFAGGYAYRLGRPNTSDYEQ